MQTLDSASVAPQCADSLFLELYRIHALNGELLNTMRVTSARDKHVTTAAIVNLIDTWLGAIAIAESPDASLLPQYEVQAVRLAVYNASATMLKKLNDAQWTRAANVIFAPTKRPRRNTKSRSHQTAKRNMIVDFVTHNPGLNVNEISQRLRMHPCTANGHLLALEADGRIRIERRGRSYRRFFADVAQQSASDVPAGESGKQMRSVPESLSFGGSICVQDGDSFLTHALET